MRRLSGAVISFDGRVVEVLGRGRGSTRIHISALAEARISEDGDGRSVVLGPLGIVMPLATTETSRALPGIQPAAASSTIRRSYAGRVRNST